MAPAPSRPGHDIERLAFFSDAVFAIALTLLAIDLRLPDSVAIVTSGELLTALADLWPRLYSFTLSFVVIVLFWIGSYRTFRYVQHVDGPFIGLNLGLLFFVVLLPFPTSVLGAHGDLLAAVVLYGVLAGVTSIFSTAVWAYASGRGRLLSPEVTPAIARYITRRAALVPLVLLGALPLALIVPQLPFVAWSVIAPAQLLMDHARHLDELAVPTVS
ncbi:MAG: TMEM175 family protein [Candidatus Limnocylindrales bacterium]